MDVNQIKEEYVIRNLCREAKIMSKLNHPCIAALYQTMQRSDNVYYLVTELVSGGDLCSFVKGHRNGKLEERPTRIYARQFASALSHMHSLGIVHRDLKMENVMLNSIQTQIKIVDFGLSNVWSADNPLRTHCGSPEYAAPELFVTGKQYGAEVDLWSLGIILYGMVLGQLPFVTSRSEYTTSQERRKKLVAQINKGMAAPHRRAIACFSSEFRHLMNRLLVADSAKRMAVKELIVHPWITDKGRRIVRTNPIKNLDSLWQAKIVTEIASLIQAEPKVVMSAIAQDPLGKIGGMFNMLVHKYQINQLNGDGVTRTLPSLTLLELSDAQKNNNKDSTCLKISTARTIQQRKVFTATASSRRADYCTPRSKLVNENLKPGGNQDMEICKHKHISSRLNRKENNSSRHRPNTVQIISSDERKTNMPDYRLIKSPTLRRKAYSANITPKTNRPFSPGTEKRKHPVTIPNKPAPPSPKLADLNKGDYQTPVIGKKGIPDAFNAIRRLPSHNVPTKQASVQKHRNPQTRVHTANIDSRSKSDHLAGTKRPLTGPLNRTLTRSIKHTSACPMAITKSACRTEKPSMNVRLATRQSRHIVENPKQLETSPLACGDADVRPSTSTNKQGKKPVIYDPIARSIAGYVANNIPDQLNNKSPLKKFKNIIATRRKPLK